MLKFECFHADTCVIVITNLGLKVPCPASVGGPEPFGIFTEGINIIYLVERTIRGSRMGHGGQVFPDGPRPHRLDLIRGTDSSLSRKVACSFSFFLLHFFRMFKYVGAC